MVETHFGWCEAPDEPARGDARPAGKANGATTSLICLFDKPPRRPRIQ